MTRDTYNGIADNNPQDPLVIETEERKIVAATDVGAGYKDENEDRMVVCSRVDTYAVIDGMGGMPRGGDAAQILAETMKEGVLSDKKMDVIQKDASKRMAEAGIEAGGAVYIAARVAGGNLTVSQAGDAGCVVYSAAGDVRFASEPERMMMGGLTNTVQGTRAGRTTQYPTVALEKDDRIVLATDGVWDNVTPEELAGLSETLSPEAAVTQLFTLITKQMEAGGGKPDNLSIIMVQVRDV